MPARSRPDGARSSSVRRAAAMAAAVTFGLAASGIFVWRGTEAVFTASTTNAGSSFAAGAVSLTDDDSGGVAFTASGLVPGSTETRCIEVTYGGTVTATGVHLYASSYSDPGGLAASITLTISEGSGGTFAGGCATPAGTSIYSGTLSSFATTKTSYASGVYLSGGSAWVPTGAGQTKVYRITYLVGASAPTSATTSLTFNWQAQAGS